MNATPPRVRVPEGVSGNFAIERFTVSKIDAAVFNQTARRNSIITGARFRPVQPGKYTRLVEYANGPDSCSDVWMSDTDAECDDHAEPIERAAGRCLVNGLGLGLVVGAMLQKPSVEKVTVVEISQDVVNLAAPFYREQYGDRFECVLADAYEWQPPRGVRYQVVWHDVWPTICGDNVATMTKLHRKYGRRTDWQGSWMRKECERLVRRSYARW